MATREACPHGCEDGWLYDWEANTAFSCQCRVPRARARRAEALTKRKREQCRRAGKASGRSRRRLRKRRRTLQGRELPLTWRARQVTRQDFERLYRRMCDGQGLAYDGRGLNTAYELYRVEWAAYRAQGQDFQTTNAQRSRALELRGRGRSRRTVQRTRRRLTDMGLVGYAHIRRGGWRVGQRDTLRVHVIPRVCADANGTPLTGAEGEGLRPSTPSAFPAGIPPPAAADGVDRAPPATSPDAIEGQPAPAGSPGEGGSLRYGSGQALARIDSTTSRGLRCSM